MKIKYWIALFGVGILLLLLCWLLWRRTPRFLKAFFTEATSPVNLAVFRIVLFAYLLVSIRFDEIFWFSRMPRGLLFPPAGLGPILRYLPIDEASVRVAAGLLMFSLTMGLVGLFTRAAAWSSVVLGLYVLGIPQFYGKIDHYHHLIWFLTLLAASPCADVLSIDAVLAARRRADRGVTAAPAASAAYSLPLRFIWLLIGVIYFGAGWWKAWTSGYRWALSENLRNLMYNKWMEFPDWRPVFPIDEYPFLYQFGGAATIVLEVSFIGLILFPRLRPLAVLGGLAFHASTLLFLRIDFSNLVICYAAFVNWDAIFRAFGRLAFRRDMVVAYDGNCKLCRRTVASLRAFDILGRISFVDALDAPALASHGLGGADRGALLRDMHAFVDGEAHAGYDAYKAMAWRLPLLWPALPFLYAPPVERIGRRVYRAVADSRTCSIAGRPDPATAPGPAPSGGGRIRGVVAIGSVLVYAALLSVVVKAHSWPMACYPTFEDLNVPEVSVIVISVEGRDHQVARIDPRRELTGMPSHRMMGLFLRILSIKDAEERRDRLAGFWRLVSQGRDDLRDATSIRFDKETLSSLPEDRDRTPTSRELLYSFAP